MSERILWGINRPDGTPVGKSPEWAAAFWANVASQAGYSHVDPWEGEVTATKAAGELTEGLIALGVPADAAQHEVVRIVITTTVDRQIDWFPADHPAWKGEDH